MDKRNKEKQVTLPETIDIGYREFKINDFRDRVGYDTDGGEIFGNMDCDKVCVNIFKHRSGCRKEVLNTVIHELLHTGTHSSGLKEYLGDEAEEQATNAYAMIVTELLIRNPDLIDFIIASTDYDEE